MTRTLALIALGCVVSLTAGCDDTGMMGPSGSGVRFIAANSSTVIIDVPQNSDADMAMAKQVATDKCAMFGGGAPVLESLNIIGSRRQRASFLCS